MHEETMYDMEDLYTWCRGGILKTYNHEQINITMIELNDNLTLQGDWSMEITVLPTQTEYKQGEFVANLLFTGSYSEDMADFSGIVKVIKREGIKLTLN